MSKPRPAFTLIEMLVAIGIIVLIATLAVLFVPDIMTQDYVNTGIANLQMWIRESKSIAVRDKRPAGIRIIPGTPNSSFCNTIQYIEQPDPWVIPNTTVNVTFTAGSPPGYRCAANGFIFSGIIAGDFLHISGMTDRQIVNVDPAGAFVDLLVASNATSGNSYYPNLTNSPYTIYRGFRPIVGYQPKIMPANVIIDMLACSSNTQSDGTTWYGSSPATSTIQAGAWDIVFSPSGGLYRSTGNSPRLWVRRADAIVNGHTFSGNMGYIAISRVTGLIGIFQVDPTPTTITNSSGTSLSAYLNPYSFSQDGKSDGM